MRRATRAATVAVIRLASTLAFVAVLFTAALHASAGAAPAVDTGRTATEFTGGYEYDALPTSTTAPTSTLINTSGIEGRAAYGSRSSTFSWTPRLAAKGIDDLAKRVPPYAGGKTQGALDVGGRQIDLISGRAGPAASIPKGTPGFDAYLRTHVEGHAAAILRQQGGGRARLAINQVPCPNCHRNLPHALPEGAELEVVGPNGFRRIYRGLPD